MNTIVALTQYRYDLLIPKETTFYLILQPQVSKYTYYKDMLHAWWYNNDYTKFKVIK